MSGIAKDLDYSYDFAGNVTTRTEVTDPTGSPIQNEWNFTYDGVSQQREVQLNNGTGGRELYYYDSAGRRYMAVTYAAATDSIPERIRVWVGGAELWYRPSANSNAMEIDTEYAYLSLGAISIGRIKSQGPVLTTEANFANGLSHIMGSVDWDTGIVNAAFIYGPYGEVVDSTGAEQGDHLRRFNGKESDQLSKLSYYGFRYYDSQSLSWTQADPKYLYVPDASGGEPRRMGLYQFTLNNPMRYKDADGRDPEYNLRKGPHFVLRALFDRIEYSDDLVSFVGAAIAIFRINSKKLGHKTTIVQSSDTDENASFHYKTGEIQINGETGAEKLLEAGFVETVGTIAHELGHAEFGQNNKGAAFLAIRSEAWAVGVEIRFVQQLLAKGIITKGEYSNWKSRVSPQLEDMLALLSPRERARAIALIKGDFAKATRDFKKRLQLKQGKNSGVTDLGCSLSSAECIHANSRAFENNISGGHPGGV